MEGLRRGEYDADISREPEEPATSICPLLTIAGGPRYDGSREQSCIGQRCAFWLAGNAAECAVAAIGYRLAIIEHVAH